MKLRSLFQSAFFLLPILAGHCTARGDSPWTLQECMRYAVEHAPQVVRQQLANANLRADRTQAVLSHLPSLSGSTGVGSSFGRSINPADNSYTNVSTFSNNYSLGAGITLFNGLQLLNNTRASKVALLRGDQQQQQLEDAIAMQTLEAYYNLRYTLGTLELTRQRTENARALLEQGRRMMELDLKSIADVALLEADFAAQEYNQTRVMNELRSQELKLKELMNFPLDRPLVVDTAERYALPQADTLKLDELIDRALEELPAAQIARLDVRAYELRLSSARAGLFPSISASGSIGSSYYTYLSGGQTRSPFNQQLQDNLSKSIGASMSIPIFAAWGRQSNITRAKNNLRSQEQAQNQALRELSVEIEQAVLDLNGAFAEREQAAKQVDARELAYRLALRKYNEGLVSAIDLQTTANHLLLAQATLLRSEFTWQAKRKQVDYYRGIPLLNP